MSDTEYVEQAINGSRVWLPQGLTSTPPAGTPMLNPAVRQVQPAPAPASVPVRRSRWSRRRSPAGPTPTPISPTGAPDSGALVVSVGPPGRQLRVPTGLEQAHPIGQPAVTVTATPATTPAIVAQQKPVKKRKERQEKEELPDGVLARISPGMVAAIGLVAMVAMSEAAYNLGSAVFTILHLPLPLAIGFPVIFEVGASTFALQDLKDRRQGHESLPMRVATYLTLITSSVVNAAVGFIGHGAAGLVELLPPLILAGVIHLHGNRATEAYKTQAVLRPKWRQAQLEAAQRESVLEVLPLLAGDDADGQATVALLRRRLESHTLEPGQALIAAGWHQRHNRVKWSGAAESRLRRLETVAATVWQDGAPEDPAPVVVSRPAPRVAAKSTASPEGASSGSASPGASGDASRPAPQGASGDASQGASDGGAGGASSTADDATLAELITQARKVRAGAGERSVRALLTERNLSASSARLREALAAAPPTPHTSLSSKALPANGSAAGSGDGQAH